MSLQKVDHIRINIRYSKPYSHMASKTAEEISVNTRNIILLKLIHYLGEKYGNKFKHSIISRDEKRKKSVMIIVNGFPTNDLSIKLKNGDTVAFFLPVAGG